MKRAHQRRERREHHECRNTQPALEQKLVALGIAQFREPKPLPLADHAGVCA
jgi:hypothetical protein